jgi:glycosyltransferase involved in cell wall biosynthesis
MKSNGLKVLVFVPHFFKQGGVALFYKSLRPFFGSNFKYFFRGNRSSNNENWAIFNYFIDYIKFLIHLLFHKTDFILINTSLAKSGCSRDAVFIYILKLFNKDFMVFFHGWNKDYEQRIETNKGFNKFPLNQFKKASSVVVLAKDFKSKLESWGFEKKIYLGKTVVENNLIEGYVNPTKKFLGESIFTFIFLARVEKAKGIIEALQIYRQIQLMNPSKKMQFKIGGEGSFLKPAKDFVAMNNIQDVHFLGHVEGLEKRLLLEEGHFLLFPSYSEGMPLSVLEAMAFGIPCMVTAVGGLKDFFVDKEMGVLLEDLDLIKAVDNVNTIINDQNWLIQISNMNYHFAQKNFLASHVAESLKELIVDVYKKKSHAQKF